MFVIIFAKVFLVVFHVSLTALYAVICSFFAQTHLEQSVNELQAVIKTVMSCMTVEAGKHDHKLFP